VRRGPGLLLLAAAWGCDRPAALLIPPWDPGQIAVLEILDPAQRPIETVPRVLEGNGPFEISLPKRIGPVRLVALIFPSFHAGGPDFSRCAVAYASSPGAALTSSRSWSSALAEIRPGDRLSLTLDQSPIGLPIQLPCTPPPPPCASSTARRVELDLGDTSPSVAFPSKELAVIGGYAIGEHLIAVTPAGASTEIHVPGLRGNVIALAYDHQDTIHGASSGGTYFQLDASGALTLSSTLAIGPLLGLSAGLDGTAIGFTSSAAYELTRGSTRAVPIADAPARLSALRVVGRSRMLALADGALHTYDGVRWSAGFSDPVVDSPDLGFPPFLGGNRSEWLAVSQLGVLVEPLGGAWGPRDDPYARPSESRTGAPFGADRLILGGSSGAIYIWDGTRWCPGQGVDLASSFSAIELSVDERAAVGVTRTTQRTSRIEVLFFDLSSF
jgi:hypothetical protein